MTLARVTEQAQHVHELERASPLTVARRELHRRMREARQEGATLQAIADAAGISKQRAGVLLNRKEQP